MNNLMFFSCTCGYRTLYTHTHTRTLTSYSLGAFRNNSQGFLISPGV